MSREERLPELAGVSALLEDATAKGHLPAAQLCVLRHGELVHLSTHGSIDGSPTARTDRFDVASVTKVMATTTATWRLLSAGEISLEERVGRFFPQASCAEATIGQLLSHRAGLPAWAPLFLPLLEDAELRRLYEGERDPALWQRARERVLGEAMALHPVGPPGGANVYGDPAYILLAAILSQVAGQRFDRFCAEELFLPLGLRHTEFIPLDRPKPPLRFAPTGLLRPRPPLSFQEGLYPVGAAIGGPGEVDDDNAWAMGGVAGHAGLFSTAEDVARWGAAILRADPAVGRREALARLLAPSGDRAVGFHRPSGAASTAGRHWSPDGRGHLGFTGCSVWLDPERALVVALLSNRVYASRSDDSGIRALRPAVHDAVIEALDG